MVSRKLRPDVEAESDCRYQAVLERVLRDARELQKLGRLQDPMSEREIALLQRELERLRAARVP